MRNSLACRHCLEQHRSIRLRIARCRSSYDKTISRCSITKSWIDLLSATRWIGAIVATDDSRERTSLASVVGPLGCGRGSYLEAADCSLAEEFGCWRRSGEAGEGNEESAGE